jgi:ribosomal-protein-alanine N-acetyltransferase
LAASHFSIRRLTPADADELTRLLVANRDAQAPFHPLRSDSFFTAEEQRDRLGAAENAYGIFDGGALAGFIALSNLVRGAFQSANLGYWVDDARRGRGLASAAVASMAELAFEELGLHRLEAATLVDNAASQRVLEKNGFRLIGLAPHYLEIAGEWRDHVLFQLTREGAQAIRADRR